MSNQSDVSKLNSVIDISSGSSCGDSLDFTFESIFREIKEKGIREMNDGEEGGVLKKKKKKKNEGCSVVLPVGFLDPLPPAVRMALSVPKWPSLDFQGCNHLWKAGDYQGGNNGGDYASNSAFADRLDNSLEEGGDSNEDIPIPTLIKLKEENRQLRERLERSEAIAAGSPNEIQFEMDRCRSLEIQLQEAQRKLEDMNREEEALLNIYQEEMKQRDDREQNMRKRMEDASNAIEALIRKVKLLENKRVIG